MRTFLAAILFAVIPSVGHADGVASPAPIWPEGFDFATFLKSPADNLISLIDPPPGCVPQVKSLLKLIDRYDRTAAAGEGTDVPTINKRIHGKLFDRKDKACRYILFRAYLLKSTLLVSGKTPHPGKEYIYRISPGIEPDRQTPALHYAMPTLIVGSLLNLLKIEFLTPRTRRSLGESWLDPLLMGAYDCYQSLIYVDVMRAPYDLGATMLHELEHFFKDKFLPDSYTQAQPEWDSDAWQGHLLNEEMVAILLGAFSEYALDFEAWINYWGYASVLEYDFLKTGEPPHQAPGDLSWVRLDGQFYRYLTESGLFGIFGDWRIAIDERQTPPGKRLGPPDRYDVLNNPDNTGPYIQSLRAKRQAAEEKHHQLHLQIFGTIESGYFSSRGKDEDWELFIDGETEPLLSYFRGMSAVEQALLPGPADFSPDMREAALFIGRADQSTFHSSQSCENYRAAIAAGKVTGYKGLSFGTKLGGAGTRPAGADPLLGGAGTRPGGAGTRPSEAVRPCFQIEVP